MTTIDFTSNELSLKEPKFHIGAAPTPIKSDKTLEPSPINGVNSIIGCNLTKGSVLPRIFCLPWSYNICIEKESALKCRVDLKGVIHLNVLILAIKLTF